MAFNFGGGLQQNAGGLNFGAQPFGAAPAFGAPAPFGGFALGAAPAAAPLKFGDAGGKAAAAGGGLKMRDRRHSEPFPSTVQSLDWSPVADNLAACDWQGTLRCWAVDSSSGHLVSSTDANMESAILDCAWGLDGSGVFTAQTDRSLRYFDLHSQKHATIGSHDAPVRTVNMAPGVNCVMTTSWDKTVRLWDIRKKNAAMVIPMPERCYAADVKGSVGVVALADGQVAILNLSPSGPSLHQVFKVKGLKMQLRCISIFNEMDGCAIGSVEGRVAIHYFDPIQAKQNNFSYRCHRSPGVGSDGYIYAVHSLSFHPEFGTYISTGADGKFMFWDKNHKTRLKLASQPMDADTPITCGRFNRNGSLIACSVGYDWSKGSEYYDASSEKSYVFIHKVEKPDVVPRASHRS